MSHIKWLILYEPWNSEQSTQANNQANTEISEQCSFGRNSPNTFFNREQGSQPEHEQTLFEEPRPYRNFQSA